MVRFSQAASIWDGQPLMLSPIGRIIYQFRWLVLLAWLGAAVGLALLAPAPDSTVGETTDLLPGDTPVHAALNELGRHFGGKSGLSAVVAVFERSDSRLTPADLEAVESVAHSIGRVRPGEAIADELADISIHTPASLAVAGNGNPLVSQDGHAALISIGLPYNYITKQAARFVKHTQEVVAECPLPLGLTVAVTGSAGYGYDYAIATERSHHKTLVVTLISVILILLWIYRAPVAAMVPLTGISIAAVVVFKLLATAGRFGLHSGTAEQIFTFVLLYGAGVDYSLLFMSRYREFLDQGRSAADSIVAALDASLVAIASSAAMTVSGLVMMCFARFSVFRHAGPAVVAALVVAAVAATTLVPAILAIVGPRVLFWPGRVSIANPQRSKFWPALAHLIVNRPRTVMGITLAVLILPALRGLHIEWNYDALFSLKSTYQARRGTEIVERHWPTGEIAPVTVLAVAPEPHAEQDWLAACTQMLSGIRNIANVANVRGLAAPLGTTADPAGNAALLLLAHDKVNAEYVSPDGRAMRLSVILNVPPFSRGAMDDARNIARAADDAAARTKLNARIYLTGATSEMIDIRAVTQQDFLRVAGLALAAILLVVTLLLRDLALSIFILAATLLSYLTTVGLSYWIFGLLGADGLEWKVQMLLFIVLVAVGQDYSIFFAVRFAQESRQLSCTQATERALIFTGPVISSCGLIMAATLGSIMAGDVKLLVQLGFAFALGMLIDTFIVRPLLLPAFIVLTNRTLKNAAGMSG
jgi:RND superfamily putative drug exporter